MSTVAAVLFAYSRYNAPVKKLEMLFGVLRLPFDALAVSLALILSYHLRIASIDLIPGRQLLDPPVTLPPFDAFLSSFLPPAVLLFLAIALVLKLYAFCPSFYWFTILYLQVFTCHLYASNFDSWAVSDTFTPKCVSL